MNLKLFLSNLRTSVRNLLKYKVQNVISILCLAVGIVCFTVTFYFASNIWYVNVIQECDPQRVDFTLERPDEDSNDTAISDIEFERLQKLRPSVIDHFLFYETYPTNNTDLVDPHGHEGRVVGRVLVVSPEYLNYYGFRSAITGKRFPRLKPGTVLMGEHLWKKILGMEGSTDGWSTNADGKGYKPISDMVKSDLRNTMDFIILVSDTPFLYDDKETSGMQAILAEGKTKADLLTELTRLFPDRKPIIWTSDSYSSRKLTVGAILLLVLFLGGSVLFIGVVGFLKMELQLFHLRVRELALRRCVGARPWQLFHLLAIEVCIVFLITLLVGLLLTGLLYDYAVPILNRAYQDMVYLDMDTIYREELAITFLTGLCALGIAALSVRRIIHVPLGMTVGRSQRTSHAGRNIMLTSQYVVCMLFLFGILLSGTLVRQEARRSHVPEDTSYLKRCLMVDEDVCGDEGFRELSALPGAERAGKEILCRFRASEIDSTLHPIYDTSYTEDGIIEHYGYNVSWINADYLLALGLHPAAATADMDRKQRVAVYAPMQDADRLARELEAPAGQHEHRVLEDGKPYVCMGYVPVWNSAYGGYTPTYYVIGEMTESQRYDLPNYRGTYYFRNVILPKPHQRQEVAEGMNAIYHRHTPGMLMPLDIICPYDRWFSTVLATDLILKIFWLLIAVGIICIVLSVYSAVSLDTRGREKEVAIRKVHGAKMWDIMRLFGRYYLRLLLISAVIAIPIAMVVTLFIVNEMGEGDHPITFCLTHLALSLLIVMLITLLTIGEKIYRVSRTNPADVIKKE